MSEVCEFQIGELDSSWNFIAQQQLYMVIRNISNCIKQGITKYDYKLEKEIIMSHGNISIYYDIMKHTLNTQINYQG